MSEFGKVEVIRSNDEEGSDVQLKVIVDYVGFKLRGLPVLGFWVYTKPHLAMGRGGFYTTVNEWEQPTGLGYRTNLPVTIGKKKMEEVANKIADKIIEMGKDIESPMPICRMNWLHCDPNWEKFIKELGIVERENEYEVED